MQVRLKPVIRYEAETMEGTPLGVFDKTDSEWNGMMKLTANGGRILIVDSPSWLDRLFGSLDVGDSDGRTASVVKGSPELLAMIGQRSPGGHRFVDGVCECGQKTTDDPVRCAVAT